jgi:hypothetical protein
MNPRLTTVSTDKHGRRNTNNARQKKYRLKKAGHTEEACPICSKKYRRPNLRCPEFDGVTLANAAVQAEGKEFDRLWAFLTIKDYGKASVAFKRAMKEVHPDLGGDSETTRRMIEAWDRRKKNLGWSGPAPTVTPKEPCKQCGYVKCQCAEIRASITRPVPEGEGSLTAGSSWQKAKATPHEPLIHVWDKVVDDDGVETARCGVEIPAESGVMDYRKATCPTCIAASKKKGGQRKPKRHTCGVKPTVTETFRHRAGRTHLRHAESPNRTLCSTVGYMPQYFEKVFFDDGDGCRYSSGKPVRLATDGKPTCVRCKKLAAPTVTPPEPAKKQKKTHVERTAGLQYRTTQGRVTWCGKEMEKRPYTAEDEELFGDCGGKKAFYETYPTLDRTQVVKDHPTCTVCQKMVVEDRFRQGLCVNEDCDQTPAPDEWYCAPCGRAARIKSGHAEPEDLVPPTVTQRYDGPTDEIGDPVCICPPDTYVQDCPHCSMPSNPKKVKPEPEAKTVVLWGVEMTPAQHEAAQARDRKEVARQSARWAKQREASA